MLNDVNVGDSFTIHGPFGNFNYSSLRDKENVLALVCGSGITPIMAMARAISDKLEDFSLTILYGEAKKKDLIFKDELDLLAKKCDKIDVHYILSDENLDGYDYGLISKEMIMGYELGKYSYFVSGPVHFYHYLNDVFKELDVPNKDIRHDIYKESELELHHILHSLTVISGEEKKVVDCYEDEPLLKAMENGGIDSPSICMVGVCGFCRSKLVSGKVKADTNYLLASDMKYHYIHPCVSYPLSDVTIVLSK